MQAEKERNSHANAPKQNKTRKYLFIQNTDNKEQKQTYEKQTRKQTYKKQARKQTDKRNHTKKHGQKRKKQAKPADTHAQNK